MYVRICFAVSWKTVCVQWGFLFKNAGLFLNEERLALALDSLRTLRRQVE
jgi:hypothetical protein